MTLLDRFTGTDGDRRVIELLLRQRLVLREEKIARYLADNGEVVEHDPGHVLIGQDGDDQDIYFILAGSVDIHVNGHYLRSRDAGTHVGEMVIVDPSARRSATVTTNSRSAFLRLSEPHFKSIAQKYPEMWRQIAAELAQRLRQRGRFHRQKNDIPIVFIGSSRESLPVAEALEGGISSPHIRVKLWPKVFDLSHHVLEDLEKQLEAVDFAILIAGPDDLVKSRGQRLKGPRDNVIFELGLFMGALTRERSFLATPSGQDLKIPSDLMGLTRLLFSWHRPGCAGLFRSRQDRADTIDVRASCQQVKDVILRKGPR